MSSTVKNAFTKQISSRRQNQILSTTEYSRVYNKETRLSLESSHGVTSKFRGGAEQPFHVEKQVSELKMRDLQGKIASYENIFERIRGLLESEARRLHPAIAKKANYILSQIDSEDIDFYDCETRPSDTPVSNTGDSFLDRLIRDPQLLEKYFEKVTTELTQQDQEIKNLKLQLEEAEIYIDQLYSSNQTLKSQLFNQEKSKSPLKVIKREKPDTSHKIQQLCLQNGKPDFSEQQREYLVASKDPPINSKSSSNYNQAYTRIKRRTLH